MPEPTCPTCHRPLTCAACTGRRGGASTSAKKREAAKVNATQPRPRKGCDFPGCKRLAQHPGAHNA